MNARPRSALVRARQAGLSLIELMIAITIGVVLMLGMVEVFGTTRAVYQTTSALSRVQEGGRFAMDYLRSDLRMGGHWGCFNEYQPIRRIYNHTSEVFNGDVPVESGADWVYRTDLPLEGFEYENTAPGEAVELTQQPALADAGSKWSPTLPTELADVLGTGDAPAVVNSDVFVVRYASPDYVPIVGSDLAAGRMSVAAADVDFIDQGALYVATDCVQVSLFQVSTAPSIEDTLPADGSVEALFTALVGGSGVNVALPDSASGPGWKEYYFGSNAIGEGAPLHRYRMAVYYVGLPLGETAPSLIRRELTLDDANEVTFSGPQRLVDGIESMQLTFGVAAPMATTALSELQGQPPNAYVTAAQLAAGENDNRSSGYVNNMRRIKKVRAALLLRGLETAAVQGSDADYNVGDVTFTAGSGDANLRAVYEAVVAVRNRY